MKKRVLISYHLPTEGFELLAKDFELIFPKDIRFSRAEVLAQISQCDALICNIDLKADQELIDAAAGRLKIIATYGVGYNQIDVKYATLRGITVANTPDPVTEPTAELAYALMGCAARRLAQSDRLLRQNELKWGTMEHLGVGLYGRTLGIIGMGRIGQSIARRGIAGGMSIIYHNRHRLPANIEKIYQTQWVTLEDLLQQSDFISISTPLNADTHHLIGAPQLALMKKTAILINTARGPVVDEEALAQALQQHAIGGAALDVFEQEPVINPLLLQLDNVVLSPHSGTSTLDARLAMNRFCAQNIYNYFQQKGRVAQVN